MQTLGGKALGPRERDLARGSVVDPQAAEKLGLALCDSADYLKSDEDCVLYLQSCLREAPEEATFIARATGTVAQTRGMMLQSTAQSSKPELYGQE